MNNPLVKYCLLILNSICAYSIGAQGLVMMEESYDLVPLEISNEGSKSVNMKIENTYATSLRPYAPSPYNQGEDANCVGWSVGYAAQTIRKAYLEKITDKHSIDSIAFSPHFIYNNVKLKDCKMGAEIPEALQFLMRTGNVSMKSFEEGISDCYVQPKNSLYELAQANKILDFKKLFTPKTTQQKKIRVVKEALINGFPVVIAMNITKSFAEMSKGEDMWYSEAGSQIPLGGHALVVVGFDELRNAFEIMNSWGDQWADEGFAYVNYEDFHKYVKYGFSFAEKSEEQFSFMVSFRRNNLITADGEAYFEKELFKWDKDKYTLAANDYRPNSTYEIDIYHSEDNYKLYCFNASGQGSYNELFKIDGSENDLIINVKTFGFTLPPLNFTDPESEKFVFIVSKNKLTHEKIESISSCSTVEEINNLFASEVDVTNRILSYSRVAVSGSIENNTMIIPVEFVVK